MYSEIFTKEQKYQFMDAIFYHDGANPHTFLVTRKKLLELG